VPESLAQSAFVIPSFVECFEDDTKLPCAQAIKVRDVGIEFMDHVVFIVLRQFAVLHADSFGPFGKTLVGRGKSPESWTVRFHKADVRAGRGIGSELKRNRLR